MPIDNLSSFNQYPLNVVGPKGQGAFVGSARIFFTGATGNVATFYGIPGLSATRVRTGIYNLQYPPTKEVTIYPALQGPTGINYNLSIANVNSFSGTSELHVTRMGAAPQTSASGADATTVSLTIRPQNPASGTRVNLLFFCSPIAEY